MVRLLWAALRRPSQRQPTALRMRQASNVIVAFFAPSAVLRNPRPSVRLSGCLPPANASVACPPLSSLSLTSLRRPPDIPPICVHPPVSSGPLIRSPLMTARHLPPSARFRSAGHDSSPWSPSLRTLPQTVSDTSSPASFGASQPCLRCTYRCTARQPASPRCKVPAFRQLMIPSQHRLPVPGWLASAGKARFYAACGCSGGP